MIISPVSGQIKGENSLRTAMAALRLLRVELYRVHYAQVPKINMDHAQKDCSDLEPPEMAVCQKVVRNVSIST